jgi:hypothetical protein
MNQQRLYGAYRPAKNLPDKSTGPSNSFKKVVGLFVIVLVLVAAITIRQNQQAHARAAAAAEATRRNNAVAKFKANLDRIASSDPLIDYSIDVSDSKYNLKSEYHSNEPSDAASTAKLISASLLLADIEKGQIKLTDRLGDGKVVYQLQAMVQRSDDNAWAQINDYLTHKSLQAYADGLGLNTYEAETNTISAADMTGFLRLLSEGKLLDSAHTKLLLSFMTHTNYEDFISPAVGRAYDFHHKVGLDADQVNDTAVISSDQDKLFISIFSNGHGSYNWEARAATFQEITKAAIAAYLD